MVESEPQLSEERPLPSRRAAARRIVRLGVPFVLAAVSAAVSGVVDVGMMGRFGAEELAAVAAGSAIFDISTNLVLAAAVGHQILSARFVGRDDPAGVRGSLASSLKLGGALSAALVAATVAAPMWLVGLVADGAELQRLGAGYLVARSPSLFAIALFTLVAATLNSYERPRYALVGGILVNVLNIGFDVLLIYGIGPFPTLGAVGNGLATSLSWLAGAVWMLAAARRFGLPRLFAQPAHAEPPEFETSVLRLSWPAMVSALLDHVSVAVFFAIIAGAGQAALAGGRIAFEVMILVFAVGSAFAAAIRILMGRALGGKRLDECLHLWRLGQTILLVPGMLLAFAIAVRRASLASMFTTSAPIIDAAAVSFALVAVSIPLIAWTIGNTNLLRAFGRTKWDMYANLTPVFLVQLPVSWLLVRRGYGVAGGFVGFAAYWLVRLGVTEVLARIAIHREATLSSTSSVPARPKAAT